MKTHCTQHTLFKILFISLLLCINIFNQAHAQTNSDNKKYYIEIPDTSDAIWKSIDAQNAALIQAIKYQQYDHITSHAMAIHSLVEALPEHPDLLTTEQLARVKAYGRWIEKLSLAIMNSADEKYQEGVIANTRQLEKTLVELRAYYPIKQLNTDNPLNAPPVNKP